MKKCLSLVVLGVLVLSTVGCTYNRHSNMGATEKWVHSDVHIVPKAFGLIFLPAIDAIISPFTASYDYLARDPQYHEDHKYLSYAGSRTVGRSDMGFGYQVWASIFTIPIETVWLLLTGPIDLFNVLVFGDSGDDVDEYDPDTAGYEPGYQD